MQSFALLIQGFERNIRTIGPCSGIGSLNSLAVLSYKSAAILILSNYFTNSARILTIRGKDSGGNAIYRGQESGITVSSGTTTDIGLVVVTQLPTATISSPLDGSTYTEGDSVIFSGTGSNTENGALSGASLVWTSSAAAPHH